MTVKEVQHKCEYWQCQFNATNTYELASHIKMKHAVDESFIYPSFNEEFECPGCDYIFLADRNFARHVYEEKISVLTVATAANIYLVKMEWLESIIRCAWLPAMATPPL